MMHKERSHFSTVLLNDTRSIWEKNLYNLTYCVGLASLELFVFLVLTEMYWMLTMTVIKPYCTSFLSFSLESVMSI